MGAKTISWDWSKTRDKERDMKMRQLKITSHLSHYQNKILSGCHTEMGFWPWFVSLSHSLHIASTLFCAELLEHRKELCQILYWLLPSTLKRKCQLLHSISKDWKLLVTVRVGQSFLEYFRRTMK